jgi:hypothetical protein
MITIDSKHMYTPHTKNAQGHVLYVRANFRVQLG